MVPNRPNLPAGMNPEMLRQMAAGMKPGGSTTTRENQENSKEKFNPLPDGKAAIQVLKSNAECPMPREAAMLNTLVQKTQEATIPEEQEAALHAAMGEAIALVFRSDKECEKHLYSRTACMFNEDSELKELSEKAEGLYKECMALEDTLKEKADAYNETSKLRWEKAVKTYGLNVEDRFYRIDPVNRIVQQVELKCEECNSVKLLRDARQKLAAALIATEAANRKEPVTVEAP